jgi:signal transduction histidine kinase
MQCPRCQQNNPFPAKFCLECCTPLRPTSGSHLQEASYGELRSALTEALEQQTATGEILRVISSSPTDVQPVFDTIMRSAVRLSGARFGAIYRFDGEMVHFVGQQGSDPDALETYQRMFPMRPDRGVLATRSILDRAVVHVPDVFQDPEYRGKDLARASGWNSVVSVPMLRDGTPIGAITISKTEAGPFTDGQIALLQTFADQAVIAIENVRLFTEVQARNRDLTKALEQQTATAEVLRIISTSLTELQPVLEVVVKSAVRFCGADDAIILRLDGEHLRAAAHHGPIPVDFALPVPCVRGTVGGRSVLERRAVHVTDLQAEAEEFPEGSRFATRLGARTTLGVPLLREGAAVGTIQLRRADVNPFTDKQIALLQTFADQAVIAIENVRLFKELEARNRDLSETLEQQMATAEILRVISSSPTDVQPVFDTIVRSALRLCNGATTAVFHVDGGMLHHPANHGGSPNALAAARARYPRPVGRDSIPGIAILTRSEYEVPETEDPSAVEMSREAGRILGIRSLFAVPMRRDGEAVGAIVVTRREPGRFAAAEVTLLKTFADQAVIAIENVRLFKELQARTGELTRSVEKLTALGEVSRAVSSTLDVETVLDTIVSRASQLAGGAGCSIFEYDPAAEQFELRATHNDDTTFVEALRAVPLRKGVGLMGRAAEMREPIQIPDITHPGAYESSVRDTLIRFGYRALLAVPLLREDQIIGSLSFNRKAPGEFPPEVVDVLKTFATQSALAIQNARLFREIADKSRQLEAASRHKSEFLANMSHELRTPFNAIIGFSEVLAEKMFGDVNDKQAEYLQDILESGRHLLSLINDILDLSKIEAGHMELDLADFDLPGALENALILVRERASRRGITLASDIDERLGVICGDERKVKQVLLNLLSNALKFTPEGGRIDVGAGRRGEVAEISVADTGIGIAPADREAVFEEFRQVGAAERKAEGTGLGLALSRKFVELHGGRIWVQSEVGRGSTFTFTLPVGTD